MKKHRSHSQRNIDVTIEAGLKTGNSHEHVHSLAVWRDGGPTSLPRNLVRPTSHPEPSTYHCMPGESVLRIRKLRSRQIWQLFFRGVASGYIVLTKRRLAPRKFKTGYCFSFGTESDGELPLFDDFNAARIEALTKLLARKA